MRKHLGLLVAGAVALAFVLGVGPATQSAQAQYFDFDGTISVSNVTSGWGVSTPDSRTVVLTSPGGGTVTLAVTPYNPTTGDSHLNATGGTDIRYSTITVDVKAGTPASRQNLSFDFDYAITITNYASEIVDPSNPATGSGVFNISGILSGSIGAGASVNLHDLKSYAIAPMQQEIGGTTYIVTTGDDFFFNKPGVGAETGSFSAHVAVPEPVSMLSTALGFLGVGGLLARGRRRNQKAA